MSESEATSLGEYVRTKREEAGLSQRQTAAKADIHHSFLARVENGDVKTLDPATLQRVCEVIGADITKALSYLGVKSTLPEPRAYFRRALGVTADDAEILAQLVEEFQSKKKKGGKYEETN